MSDFFRFLADLQHRWKFHVELKENLLEYDGGY